jgi:hypothetical protein
MIIDFTRFPRRLHKVTDDSHHAVSVWDTAGAARPKLRAIVGVAVLIALTAVGTAGMEAGAAEEHQGAALFSDSSGGSNADAGVGLFGSTRDQTLRRGSASFAPVPQQVDLFGDSLGYQAEPYLDMFFTDTHDYTVSNYTYGGTATCDWLSRMVAAAAERPLAALLVFSGNAFTPCMDGVTLRSPQYYDLYATYTEQAIGIFSAVGAHVFLVGTPVDESSVAG